MQFGNSIAKLHVIPQQGFHALGEEVRLKRKIVVCREKTRRRASDGAEIMPPKAFFKEL
jgi:hypothetical protein